MRICILPLHALSFDEHTVRSLPFGESEQTRLLAITNEARAKSSLGALLALKMLTQNAYPIARTPEGKPYFDAPNAPAFSLSHSDTLAVAALADDGEGEIGIDLEDIRPCPHAARVAERFFDEQERARLAASPTDETFFALWTAKEATAKIDGRGLAAVFSISTPRAERRQARLRGDGIDAVLCVAAEHPIGSLTWQCPAAITVQEPKRSPYV